MAGFYGNIHKNPSVHPLLDSNHKDVSSVITYTHLYNNSKIVYLMPRFTREAYENKLYKKLIINAFIVYKKTNKNVK